MSSADPREPDNLCGQALATELPWEDLAEEYDPETWYVAADGTHYCCREVWDDADTDRCIWHADVPNKPAKALATARSERPERLDRAVLRESDLRDDVFFSDCRLPGADLGGANLREADLGGADLEAANLGGADLEDADLGRADLGDADLGGADLREADLGEANLGNADLSEADIVRAHLGRADLGDADLGEADLRAADLSEADLENADLGGAALLAADLGGAVLVEADLGGAVLWDADLGGADLWDTDFGGASLENIDLGGEFLFKADLAGADLKEADLGEADLRNANLTGADLREADLGGVDLRNANLDGADLRNADLDGANMLHADLGGTLLVWADLGGADLHGADLTACKLHQTTFEDATFDESTVFGAASGHEDEADAAAEDASWLASHVSSRLRGIGRPSTDPEPLEKAETQYRTVQRLRREHDLKQDPALEVQEKHARRKRALAERRYWDWLKLAVYRWPIGYGEQPRNVVGTSLAVVGLSALLYPLFGLRVGKSGLGATTIGYPFDGVGLVTGLGKSLYFSVITFTTLGYGDVQPLGHGEALATAESLVGAFLMALLVYVLGRRATW